MIERVGGNESGGIVGSAVALSALAAAISLRSVAGLKSAGSISLCIIKSQSVSIERFRVRTIFISELNVGASSVVWLKFVFISTLPPGFVAPLVFRPKYSA